MDWSWIELSITEHFVQVRAPRKDDTPRLAVMTRKKKGEEDFEYAVTPYRGEWSKGPVGAFVTDIAAKRGSNTDSAVLEDVPWFDKPPKGYQTKETKEVRSEISVGACIAQCEDEFKSSRGSRTNPVMF